MRVLKAALLGTVLMLVVAVLAPVSSATAVTARKAPYRVSEFIPSTNQAGHGLLVHGKVSPDARGQYVRIQVRAPGQASWSTKRLAIVRKGSAYSARIFLFGDGVHQVRIVKPAGRGHARGVSRVDTVTVSDPSTP